MEVTGKGEVRGMDAPSMTAPIGNHATFAAANSRKYAMGNTPDPCYCGCCNMKRSAV